MIKIRPPESIFQTKGSIDNGTFAGRWHFSFDQYFDPEFVRFGNLRVFNDDILSDGAVWPLHPHREIEVISYCAAGEFRHADEHGLGGVLKKGDVQHTTVGTGMWHSEINNRQDVPLRFIQMWFIPEKENLKPQVEQKEISIKDRTDKFHLLVSRNDKNALPIRSDAAVYSSRISKDKTLIQKLDSKRGYYLCFLEGTSLRVNKQEIKEKGAAMIINEKRIEVISSSASELLLIDVGLIQNK